MKEFFKNLVLRYLIFLARARLRRLRPFIIGVTGSVGKTSTKDAIFTILKTRYTIVRNEKSFNTEFGLPLAILEQPSGFSQPLAWVGIMVKSFFKAFFGGHHLQMMVLEMGVDKPGDMTQLLSVVRPQVGVMTAIKPVHLAPGQFKDLEDIFMEKKRLIESLPEKGTAILNADDGYILGLRDHLVCKKIWYGMSEIADLRVLELESSIQGVRFTLSYKGQTVTAELPLLGKFQIYVILPAVAVALTQGFTLEEAVEALKSYSLPPGRMSYLEGLQGSHIIDSTYNASPMAVKEALNVLLDVAQGRKIAVLGSMNELGLMSEKYHREVGSYAAQKVDILVTVGDSAKNIGVQAAEEGFPQDALFHYTDAIAAAHFLQTFLEKGDTLLVKGSQNQVRLERLVKMLLLDPSQAESVLVRQDWHN